MEVSKKYVVYELNSVMGSSRHLALEEIQFDSWISNSFDTEEEAIQALIDDDKTYTDYIILKTIHIR